MGDHQTANMAKIALTALLLMLAATVIHATQADEASWTERDDEYELAGINSRLSEGSSSSSSSIGFRSSSMGSSSRRRVPTTPAPTPPTASPTTFAPTPPTASPTTPAPTPTES